MGDNGQVVDRLQVCEGNGHMVSSILTNPPSKQPTPSTSTPFPPTANGSLVPRPATTPNGDFSKDSGQSMGGFSSMTNLSTTSPRGRPGPPGGANRAFKSQISAPANTPTISLFGIKKNGPAGDAGVANVKCTTKQVPVSMSKEARPGPIQRPTTIPGKQTGSTANLLKMNVVSTVKLKRQPSTTAPTQALPPTATPSVSQPTTSTASQPTRVPPPPLPVHRVPPPRLPGLKSQSVSQTNPKQESTSKCVNLPSAGVSGPYTFGNSPTTSLNGGAGGALPVQNGTRPVSAGSNPVGSRLAGEEIDKGLIARATAMSKSTSASGPSQSAGVAKTKHPFVKSDSVGRASPALSQSSSGHGVGSPTTGLFHKKSIAKVQVQSKPKQS